MTATPTLSVDVRVPDLREPVARQLIGAAFDLLTVSQAKRLATEMLEEKTNGLAGPGEA